MRSRTLDACEAGKRVRGEEHESSQVHSLAIPREPNTTGASHDVCIHMEIATPQLPRSLGALPRSSSDSAAPSCATNTTGKQKNIHRGNSPIRYIHVHTDAGRTGTRDQ